MASRRKPLNKYDSCNRKKKKKMKELEENEIFVVDAAQVQSELKGLDQGDLGLWGFGLGRPRVFGQGNLGFFFVFFILLCCSLCLFLLFLQYYAFLLFRSSLLLLPLGNLSLKDSSSMSNLSLLQLSCQVKSSLTDSRCQFSKQFGNGVN